MKDQILEALNHNDYNNTPERRLWVAVLITYVDELIACVRKKESAKRRKRYKEKTDWMNEKTEKELEDWNELAIQSVLLQAKTADTKEICNMININHKWFVSCLIDISKQENPTRPQLDFP